MIDQFSLHNFIHFHLQGCLFDLASVQSVNLFERTVQLVNLNHFNSDYLVIYVGFYTQNKVEVKAFL